MQTQRRPAPGPAGWAWGQRGVVAGAVAPAMAATQFRRPTGREQETHRVSPPARDGAL
jgi:hypothetical protein